MTISMLVVDSPFAVVAADQRYTVEWFEGEQHGVTRGTHRKVGAHPTLGLVWVSAGIGVVHRGDEARKVNDLILEALEHPLDGPLNERVVPRLVDFLWPLVQAELDLGGYDDVAPELATLAILLGISGQAEAGGELIKLGRTAEATVAARMILPSTHTTPYIESIAKDSWFPPPLSRPRDIARHMRKLLEGAIAYAEQIEGAEADVGGEVDVAIAGPQGARVLTN